MKDLFIRAMCFLAQTIASFVISSLLTTLSTSALVIFSSNIGIFYIIAFAAMVFLACFLITYNCFRLRFPNLTWDEVININTYELEIENDSEAKYTKMCKFKVRANVSSSIMYGQYDWRECDVLNVDFNKTSNGYTEIRYEGIDKDNRTRRGKINKGQAFPTLFKSMKYEVIFPCNDACEEKKVEYSISLDYNKETLQELYAIIKRPVKKLNLKLVVSDNVHIENVYYDVFTSEGHKNIIISKKELYPKRIGTTHDGKSVYSISFNNPRLLCKYAIHWDWR